MQKKSKIRILMISSSSQMGGGAKHMFLLGENTNKNFEIFYAIPQNNNFTKYLDTKNHLKISERKIKPRDIFNFIKFANLHSIDIIHAHGKGAGALARITSFFLKKPVIYTFHGIHLKCHNWYKRLFYVFYEYLLGWIDTSKILVSKSEKNYAEKSKIYLGTNSIIINNGVSNMPQKGSKESDPYLIKNINYSKTNIISVCRFEQQKNIRDILKIALKLSNFNFNIIGDGPIWEEIENLILEKNIRNVFLLGKKKNVFNYLYSSDIYLSTSLYEGLPLSILEAMSIGLPIVASNVVGNCDTVENGISGYFYELKNINKAVYYLVKLAKNKNLRKKMGDAAFYRQRNIFSKNKMVSKYQKLYKNIISSR
tara:strand:- start:4070 stop:5173 length:1104 start_codon:yes stop_codon:yes gene_type:complete